MVLPADFPADRTLAVVAFQRGQQSRVDRWIERAVAAGVPPTTRGATGSIPAAVVEVPALSTQWRPVRRFIDGGMTAGIGDPDVLARTITVCMLAKYQAGLTFAKAAEFETGASPYQDVSLLTKARNALVHFRPETVAEDDIMELQRKLASRFDDNALLAGTGNPWFHSKMLGAGFALWATEVSGTFADAWITKMGLPGTFRADLKSFPAP